MLALAVLHPASGPLLAQPAESDQVTAESISGQIAEVKSNQELDEAVRTRAVEQLNLAAEVIKGVGATGEQIEEWKRLAAQAPPEITQLEEQIEKLEADQYALPEPPPALERLAERLGQLKQSLVTAQTRLSDYKARLETLNRRRTDLPGALAAQQEQIETVQSQLDALSESADPPEVKKAQRTLLLARLKLQKAQLAQLQAEQLTQEARQKLRIAQRDLAQKRVALLTPAVEAWQAAHDAARSAQAERERRETARQGRQARRLHPVLETYAEANERLSRLKAEITEEITALDPVKPDAEDVRGRYEQMRRAVESDLPGDLGQAMRSERQALPSIRQLTARREKLRQRMLEVQDLEARLSADLEQIDTIQAEKRRLLTGIDANGQASEEIEQAAEELVATRRATLEALADDATGLIGELRGKLREKEAQLLDLIAVTREYRRFISEHILYIRSMDPLWYGDLQRIGQGVLLLLDPDAWVNVGRTLGDQARRHPVLLLVGVVLLGGLLLAQPRLVGRLKRLDQRVEEGYPGRFLDTVWALLITLALTVCWPGILAFVGWRLWVSTLAGPLAYGLGVALMIVAAAWLPIMLLRQVCRRMGLGEVHFRWGADVCRMTCRATLKLATLGVPILLLIGLGEGHTSDALEALGRLSAIVGLLLLALWVQRFLRPSGQFIRSTVGRRKNNWLWRFRHVWMPLAALVPIALAVAAAAGYYYTALQLLWRLLTQAGFIILLIVVNALLLRWVLLGRRRLALATIAKRRQAEKEKAQQEEDVPPELPAETKQPQIDLSAVGVQTRQFIRYVMAAAMLVSAWVIWDDVLPALQFLDRFTVYGEVTIQSILAAAALVLLTVMVSRNLPGVLDITVFHRLELETGSQFALNALIRYVVLVVGFVLAFNAVGVNWDHVQWLVAAMTVGLGFGLQEIFANFVSGLIILIERPIRVGDIVTVGTITGTVTQIRMRATTVTDLDRKELIVPNRDFITTQLVNWTLSDNVIRVVVPVGIAYGSETETARKILLEVAAKDQRVLDEPEPSCLFMGFGESSLDFELRVFVGGLRDYFEARSALHMAIDQAFRKADIEIAFPQRDLHLRTVSAALPVEARQVEQIMRQNTEDRRQ